MTHILTFRQRQVLAIIEKYLSKKGYSPSLTEIQKELKVKFKRSVVQYLEALERKGFINRTSRARGIRLVARSNDRLFVSVPVFGYANAGEPLAIAEEEKLGELKVERKLLPQKRNIFAVIVRGDSMNQCVIEGTALENGNYAVIAKNTPVRDGEVLLAVIDGSATIKRVKRTKGMLLLYPQSTNSRHKPIYMSRGNNAYINGKVIAALENPLS